MHYPVLNLQVDVRLLGLDTDAITKAVVINVHQFRRVKYLDLFLS